jgi:hypothetical protein
MEKRKLHLRVPVTQPEKEEIANKAKQAGLSVAAYLRNLGCNYPLKSKLDLEITRELLKVGGDMGRMGGLFKLALSEDKAPDPEAIRLLMNDIEQARISFLALIKSFPTLK